MSDSVKKYYELIEEGVIDPSTNNIDRPYIYESPDGGKTVRRRKLGDIENTEVIEKSKENEKYTELELAECIVNIARKYQTANPSLVLYMAKDELSVKKVCD